MKRVWIGFSKKNAIGSKLIRAFLCSPFSHTYFRFKDDNLNDSMIFHAVGKGLVFISNENFIKHNEKVSEFEFGISEELYIELRNECNKYAGLQYGIFQNIGLAIMKYLNLNKNPLNDGINCSEWVSYCLEELYPEEWSSLYKDFNSVDPKQVYEYLINKKANRIL